MKKNLYELVESIKNGMITSEEVVKHYLDEIKEKEDVINAFISIYEDEALEKARVIDLKIRNGEAVGRLAGIPIAIKDNICTNGLKTTCGSKMLEDFIPPYDATVIEKILNEDGIIIGKTNMDEFAMGSSTENSAFKKTLNPIDITRVPGGSSGGSAATVAAGMCPIALGSDTGGSIRQPASFCGVVGLKPTYGLVSRFGLIAFASSLDQIGPFTNSVYDSAYLLNILAGEDNLDSTTIKNLPSTDYTHNIDTGVSGMKIGIPLEFFSKGLDYEVRDAIIKSIKLLKDLGAEIYEFSLPISTEGLSSYYIISSAEASSNLARYDGIRYGYRTKEFDSIEELIEKSRTEGFGREVKRRIMMGTYTLSAGYYDAYYDKAEKFRNKLKRDFKEVFSKYDLILCPSSPILPFKVGEKIDNPISMYLSDVYTVNVNLAGNPALSLPVGKSKDGLPIGVQLIGDLLCEKKIFKAAYSLEKRLLQE